ncbi:hypothetical protein C5167_026114, partial [Papaver somniferum]
YLPNYTDRHSSKESPCRPTELNPREETYLFIYKKKKSNTRRISREGNSTTPKPTVKDIDPMTRINPISWVGKLLRSLHIKGKNTTTDCQADLPRDIILDILSRLPAELIFRCQSVSRPLQVLTTTPFFIHMQRQRSTSLIVVQLRSSEELPVCKFAKLCYMDKEFERIEEKFFESLSTPIGSSYCSTTNTRFLLGSYDGFLMFANFDGLPESFYIWNPITEEQLAIDDANTHVCGLYFNPVIKYHELLYYTTTYGNADFGQYYNFGAYNLRTKLRRDVGRFPYTPSTHRLPVIVNGGIILDD